MNVSTLASMQAIHSALAPACKAQGVQDLGLCMQPHRPALANLCRARDMQHRGSVQDMQFQGQQMALWGC